MIIPLREENRPLSSRGADLHLASVKNAIKLQLDQMSDGSLNLDISGTRLSLSDALGVNVTIKIANYLKKQFTIYKGSKIVVKFFDSAKEIFER